MRRYVCGLKYMLSLLSSRLCRGNFSRHSQCFVGILGEDLAAYQLHSQNPPKTFGMSRKVAATYVTEKEDFPRHNYVTEKEY